ncbi:unnamed protein product [Strongylus vulgaris]|uniref:Peptidase A1 domain-containing protein n=1 Tax=Strongylus vulgaris TaxID=40348 RepID=A0A3P7IPI8_STRVU|nr:unnamed protein product [Strongylus vulgaris]
MKLAVVVFALIVPAHCLKIPLPFGGLNLGRTPGGEFIVGIQRGVEVLGNGYNSDTSLAIGKNATFNVNNAHDVLVNGRKSGPRSSLGFGKNGFQIGSGFSVLEPSKVGFSL